jgi:putative glutamine amidotransferase
LIGLPADRRLFEPHHLHTVGEKYLIAVTDVIGGLPVILPALPGRSDPRQLLDHLDGLLLTGGYSNILPHLYGQESQEEPSCLRDPERDAANLELIPLAIGIGMPIFGICRGLQELNVALGGTLLQKVHEAPGKMDHREDKEASLDEQYGPAHPIEIVPGGLLARISGVTEAVVNSVHGQGIDRLAPGLRIEATAPDGLIEAVSLPDAQSFVMAVQFHPEWKPAQNPFALSILRAFGDACRQYAQRKSGR